MGKNGLDLTSDRRDRAAGRIDLPDLATEPLGLPEDDIERFGEEVLPAVGGGPPVGAPKASDEHVGPAP
jgi:hypothetical protein